MDYLQPIPSRKDINLAELKALTPEEVIFASTSIENPENGCIYTIDFLFTQRPAPIIRISTEKRDTLLSKVTEEEAQEDLINLAKYVRSITGGVFDIHPFYGFVWGTRLTQIVPGFGSPASMNDDLTIIIALSDANPLEFDEQTTDRIASMGTTISSNDPEAGEFAEYLGTEFSNPNQKHRDTAIANDLGVKYELEVVRSNVAPDIPDAINLTPGNAAYILELLQEKKGFTNPKVPKVNLRK